MTTVRERVISELERVGLSQKKAGKAIGVAQQTVNGWYGGSTPGGEGLEKVVRYTGVNGHWLLTGQGDRYKVDAGAAALVGQGFAYGLRAVREAIERVQATSVGEDALSRALAEEPQAEQASREYQRRQQDRRGGGQDR